MIRFSAFLVAVAVGLLVAGAVTSKLVLVYAAIGVSGIALLALGAGALIKRSELSGQPEPAEPALARAEPSGVRVMPASAAVPWAAAVPADSVPADSVPADSVPADSVPADSVSADAVPADAEPVTSQSTAHGRSAPQSASYGPASPPAASPRPAAPQPGPSLAGYLPADAMAGRPGAWERKGDAPATQPLREVPRPASPPAPPPASPPVSAAAASTEAPPLPGDAAPAGSPPVGHPQSGETQPAATSRPAAQDQPSAEERPPDEPPADQQTQRLPASARTALAEPAPPASSSVPGSAPDLQREVTVVPGVPRYHNAHCLLIRFMGENDLDKMTLGAAKDAGCTPCRACLPDQPDATLTR